MQDVLIVGGGIVGLATAYQLSQQSPHLKITLLEKENSLAFHQTGRNSGVLHSGIYYKPGSLKAQLCRQGKAALEAFCQQEAIPYERCGKVIVATSEAELPALRQLFERGQANGVRCAWLDQAELRQLEPHTAGITAVHVPETGIVDYKQVCERLADHLRQRGHTLLLGTKVLAMEERPSEVMALTTRGEINGRQLVNCAGLYSDRLASHSGLATYSGQPAAQIIPFRGEYFQLTPEAEPLCHGLIYPVPDARFPFLGVHFTRLVGGGVECGPNAVLAFAREGYGKLEVNGRDLWQILAYPGFQKLAARYWRTGLGEMWRSASKRAFVHALQRLIPDIQTHHLIPAPPGIRAQAIAFDGSLVDDFAFQQSRRLLHVINAPSPAATASFAIGQAIVARLGAE